MKLIIDIPWQIKECLNNENEWTALLLAEVKDIVNNGVPIEQEPKIDIRDNRVKNELNRVKDELVPKTDILDRIRAEIIEERECAYADFDKYKVDYLGVDSRYVEDELPYDDFRYGMERVIEIIDKYRQED